MITMTKDLKEISMVNPPHTDGNNHTNVTTEVHTTNRNQNNDLNISNHCNIEQSQHNEHLENNNDDINDSSNMLDTIPIDNNTDTRRSTQNQTIQLRPIQIRFYLYTQMYTYR